MARPRTGQTGEPTNIYLPRTLKRKAAKLAAQKHDKSLSWLIVQLLTKEVSKEGVK